MADMKNLGAALRAMPPKKLLAFAAIIALTIAALMLVFSWAQKADFQPLYANLSDEDAGRIIQKLNELRVPYATSAGGIMVPADRVYELRLQLASEGLPQGGGVGFELFDKTSFTMTDFVQKLNYRRALQGELGRTIRGLSEVEQCRVHLAIPEKSLFAQKEERPKASVLVKLRPGRRLSQGQVRGIVHLVSSSVEGLDPGDVSVVDSGGDVLTAPADDAFAAGGRQLEHQRAFEREMEARIASMLEPVVGRGKVRARVAASLDFTKIEKTEEKYDPDSQVVRSEQKNVEKTSNTTAGGGGGVPGVASNLPGKPQQQAGASSSEHRTYSEKKSETVNYEITKVVSRVVSPSGDVKRLSVVAIVDGTYSAAPGSSEKKYAPRSEEDLQQFEDMVKKAVGFNAERGDEVKVVNMPFEAAAQEDLPEGGPEAAGAALLPLVMTVLKYLVPVAVAAFLFLFVVRPLLRAVAAQPAIYEHPMPALPQRVGEPERGMERKEIASREHLVEWARKNPKEATSLVKGWLEEK